jgi:hypothetical protein
MGHLVDELWEHSRCSVAAQCRYPVVACSTHNGYSTRLSWPEFHLKVAIMCGDLTLNQRQMIWD